jgi:hypothetical protein
VAFIGPGMNRYPVGAETLHVRGGFHHVWIVASAAVAKCCQFVDVDRKFCRHVSKIIICLNRDTHDERMNGTKQQNHQFNQLQIQIMPLSRFRRKKLPNRKLF